MKKTTKKRKRKKKKKKTRKRKKKIDVRSRIPKVFLKMKEKKRSTKRKERNGPRMKRRSQKWSRRTITWWRMPMPRLKPWAFPLPLAGRKVLSSPLQPSTLETSSASGEQLEVRASY